MRDINEAMIIDIKSEDVIERFGIEDANPYFLYKLSINEEGVVIYEFDPNKKSIIRDIDLSKQLDSVGYIPSKELPICEVSDYFGDLVSESVSKNSAVVGTKEDYDMSLFDRIRYYIFGRR